MLMKATKQGEFFFLFTLFVFFTMETNQGLGDPFKDSQSWCCWKGKGRCYTDGAANTKNLAML